MLPPRPTPTEAVLAWERQHFFAGSWVCAGRSAPTWPTPATAGPCASATTACCSSAATTACCAAFYNVCRHRGHELLPVRRPSVKRATHRLPVPRLDLRPRRHAARSRPASTRPRASTSPTTRCSPVPRRGVARLGVRERVGRRRPARRPPRRPRPSEIAPLRAGAARRRRHPRLRAGRELEARRSRTTTSATTARPSTRSCAGSARRRAATTSTTAPGCGSAARWTWSTAPRRCRSTARARGPLLPGVDETLAARGASTSACFPNLLHQPRTRTT